ncbi:glycosyl transferase family 1 [Halobacillus faecis]|uniref:Glycosyl transferase family 1 n=1 Tax=Halobacillus faecis TaxID=360184 RepID=A0A511WU09_9BACI|nr:glycosyl transferase family 1 [Halobacillus faecis]
MTRYYIPSFKAGGPVQSIKNLVDNLSDKYDFHVLTSDRDIGENKPFEKIEVDKWEKVGNAKVFYTDISRLSIKKMTKIINSINFDIIYLNSFFSFKFSILPVVLKNLNIIKRNSPLVIAPRGEFSPGALNLKSFKKKIFINTSKFFNLYKNVNWHATAVTESEDIKRNLNKDIDVTIANNLTSDYESLNFNKQIKKYKNKLKVVFISRIHPKKNLKFALSILNDIQGDIDFNIYGPIEDQKYWLECKKIINTLPSNINVNYNGISEHKDVFNIFNNNHVFLFPTYGENFGHVISEALIGGCPVIISDQTPWRELEEKSVGWDIPLNKYRQFNNVIKTCLEMDQKEYDDISKRAFLFAKKEASNYRNKLQYETLFEI